MKMHLKQIKHTLKKTPILGRLLLKIKKIISPGVNFINSSQYWDDRYKSGGTSGAGSYGRLAEFKANVLNSFIKKHDIRSVIEWGCGDGNQLMLSIYPSYLGIDVSSIAVKQCKDKFKNNPRYYFKLYDEYQGECFDLAISLDVIYHLVEDSIFHDYMLKLFSSANKFVVIYAYNFDKHYELPHERGREFMLWVQKNAVQWKLVKKIENEYPYDPNNSSNTSQSDFYIFEFTGS